MRSDRIPRRRALAGGAALAVASVAGCVATGRGAEETVTRTVDPADADAAVAVDTGSGDVVLALPDRHVESEDDVEVEVADGTHAVTIDAGSGDVEVTVG